MMMGEEVKGRTTKITVYAKRRYTTRTAKATTAADGAETVANLNSRDSRVDRPQHRLLVIHRIAHTQA